MKIHCNHFFGGNADGLAAPRRSEHGSATVVFIALLAIMAMLVTVNGKALFRLHREVKWIEQQQVNRLTASQTNVVMVAQPESK